jgi:hypothetical protein
MSLRNDSELGKLAEAASQYLQAGCGDHECEYFTSIDLRIASKLPFSTTKIRNIAQLRAGSAARARER